MASKIKKFNFSGCQHLRKVLIDGNVEVEGKIDFSETPLKDKNDIFNVDDKFKNIPDGITATPEFLRNKIKIKVSTSEMGTQTDEGIGDLSNLNLSDDDKKFMELMNDNLFWYNDFPVRSRKDYLEQRASQLKDFLNSPAGENINEKLRLLAEHILSVSEKILDNAAYFDKMGNIINPSEKNWLGFYNFLITEILDQDGIIFKFKPNLDGKYNITPSDLSQDALDRFMNTLEATTDKNGSKYYTFAEYNDRWELKQYYNKDTRFIGIKPQKINTVNNFVERKISDSGEKVLKNIFKYWKVNIASSSEDKKNLEYYRNLYYEIDKKLEEANKKLNPTWKDFIKFSKGITDPRKSNFPPAVYQVLEIMLQNNLFPPMNPNYTWSSYFSNVYTFGDPASFNRVFTQPEYAFFNETYGKWKKTWYILNPF